MFLRMLFLPCVVASLALILSASPVFAHADGHNFSGGFASGFLHPILGWDHLTAMVAVGLWGAFLGRPAVWMLPVVFPLVMALGGALGIIGVPIPEVETGIAASSVVLGLLIAAGMRLPLSIAMVIVGLFAIFHGHAHGNELPHSAGPLPYAVGFVLGTGVLHTAGIALGFVTKMPNGAAIGRAMGGMIALAGLGFLFGFL